MPQIRCPRCGLTINLENRRNMDFKLIIDAVKQKARTFTELLSLTSLPRKTLNLRLNELCQNEVLTKAKGFYQLNGHISSRKSFTYSFSNAFSNRKIKGLVVLVILLAGFPTMSYALAILFPTTHYVPSKEPMILGTFKVEIEVGDVKDLWAWQVLISFNPDELKYLNWSCGGIIRAEPPFQLTNPEDDIAKGCLLIGATLMAGEPGVDVEGKQTLAYITFGYYVKNYIPPKIIIEGTGPFKTSLLNSELQEIPITDETLSIKILS
jgi:hypothetical protein